MWTKTRIYLDKKSLLYAPLKHFLPRIIRKSEKIVLNQQALKDYLLLFLPNPSKRLKWSLNTSRSWIYLKLRKTQKKCMPRPLNPSTILRKFSRLRMSYLSRKRKSRIFKKSSIVAVSLNCIFTWLSRVLWENKSLFQWTVRTSRSLWMKAVAMFQTWIGLLKISSQKL